MITLPADIERLAAQLAARKGLSVERFIAEIVRDQARREGTWEPRAGEPKRRPSARQMREIAKRAASRPVLDDRSPDELVGFDEIGAPT